jgi:outer membrane protein W
MKKITLLLFAFSLLKLNAQSFYKGALILDAGGGLEIFNTRSTYVEKSTGQSRSDEDKDGNSNFTLGAEYGILKNLGVGLRSKSNNYFVEKDSTSGTKGSVKSNDVLVLVNYHVVSKNKFDLVVGANFGYSGIKYHFNDPKNTQVKGSGLYYSFYVDPRIYFGRFGLNLNLGLPFVNYPKLTSGSEDFKNAFSSLSLKGSPGVCWNIGIQFRLMSAIQN